MEERQFSGAPLRKAGNHWYGQVLITRDPCVIHEATLAKPSVEGDLFLRIISYNKEALHAPPRYIISKQTPTGDPN